MITNMSITSTQRKWTKTACACYLRGCRCSGCYYEWFFRDSPYKCKMKYTILELIKKFGLPENLQNKFGVKEEE